MSKFDLQQALRNLDIEVKPFGYRGLGVPDMPLEERATCRGYSMDRWLAINPIEAWPEFVTFHEMTHILLGHTVDYKNWGIDPAKPHGGIGSEKAQQFIAWQEAIHDLKEAECHATAILAAQLTKIPFDFTFEMEHLLYNYTLGRDIPEDVMKRACETAKQIWTAGEVQRRWFAA